MGAGWLVQERPAGEDADGQYPDIHLGAIGDDVSIIGFVETVRSILNAAGLGFSRLYGTWIVSKPPDRTTARIASGWPVPVRPRNRDQPGRFYLAERIQHTVGPEHVGRGDRERLVLAPCRQAVVQLQERNGWPPEPVEALLDRPPDRPANVGEVGRAEPDLGGDVRRPAGFPISRRARPTLASDVPCP